MAFQLREVDRAKLYTSIVDQILEGIRSSTFVPGKALPPERILAERLGVSRSSVREAIRVLEYAGVLDVRTGSGTYVTNASLSDAMTLRAHAALIGEQSPLDVMVARRALEPLCAKLAAQNHNRQDLRKLNAAVGEQAALVESGEDSTNADLAFHLAIAAASRNPTLAMLMERLVDIMHQHLWREMKHQKLERAGIQQRFLEAHRTILGYVDARDAERAARAMEKHLVAVEAGMVDGANALAGAS
jgi:GntR family transcriptional repressor for pyruvate dehydrogenase complex